MSQQDKVERALRVTLERFERGEFITGQRRSDFPGEPTYYCLVGSLQEQLMPKLKYTRYVAEEDIPSAYTAAIRSLGFENEVDAMRFNDGWGRKKVIERIKLALEGGCEYAALHRALDDSRVAHAKRDLGRKIPNVVPLAWMEQAFSETFAEEVQV